MAADDNAKLLIVLEAQSKKLQNQLVDATRTIDRFASQTNRRFDAMNAKNAASFDALNRKVGVSLGALQAGIAKAFAGAAALRGAQMLIDASTRIENSLKVTGLAGDELTRVYDSLFESAQRNMAPLESLTTLYGRAAQVQSELGASSADLLKFTDNIAIALRINGRSAQESSGALLQLGQALGSSRVMAEEFNSINEGARPILQAAAAGILEAGGSVAKLKQLVIDGKISNQAFFQGIQAGSEILEEKLVGAEASVSQSFIRLRNVLIDVAGDFNTGTGASASFAQSLDQLGAAIQNISGNEDFNTFLDYINDLGNDSFANTAREFEQISSAVQAIKSAFSDTTAEVDRTQQAASDAQAALEAFASANGGNFTEEVEAAFRDLVIQLINGKGDIESTRAAIMAMGTADPSFDKVIGKVDILTATFIRLREAAYAALRTATQTPVPTNGGYAGQEAAGPQMVSSKVKPITAADYPVIGGDSGKKGAKSPGEKFDDLLKKQAEENRLLQERTALQSTLNPLVNDYGFALEKLQVQQELQTAATAAGLELTPELKATIDELATGYANASVEAAKLAESQDQLKKINADFGEAGKSAIKGFISDLREGKSAADALGNAMSSILDSVIDIGLNMLLGGGAGGGLFGGIGRLFGFADGGIASNGKPMKTFARGGVSNSAAIFGEAGPEAAVPLPDGRRIPVDLRMPAANDNAKRAGGELIVHVSLDSELLRAEVTNVSGQVVARATPTIIRAANDSAPVAAAEAQSRRG